MIRIHWLLLVGVFLVGFGVGRLLLEVSNKPSPAMEEWTEEWEDWKKRSREWEEGYKKWKKEHSTDQTGKTTICPSHGKLLQEPPVQGMPAEQF